MASSVSAYSSTAPRPSNLLWLHPPPSSPVKPSLAAPTPVVATNNLLHNNLQHNRISEPLSSRLVVQKMASKRSFCLPALTPAELAQTPHKQFCRTLNGFQYTYVVPTGRAACAYCGITSISFGATVKHQSKCNKNPAYQEKVSWTSELPYV
jgi:hypothetical protein